MRKIISLMMVLVLGVVLVGSSAFATNPDPNRINPWEYNGRPDPGGDDGGWTEPHMIIRLDFGVFALLGCSITGTPGLSYSLIFILTPVKDIDNGFNDDETNDHGTTLEGRRTASGASIR